MALSPVEIDRYERQLLVPGWGAAGQERVRASSVRVLGDGVAAEIAVAYLVAAGVGAVAAAARIAESAAAGAPGVTIAPLDGEATRAPGGCAAAVAVAGETIVAAVDGHADGALLAVEALKAILGHPFARRVAAPAPALPRA